MLANHKQPTVQCCSGEGGVGTVVLMGSKGQLRCNAIECTKELVTNQTTSDEGSNQTIRGKFSRRTRECATDKWRRRAEFVWEAWELDRKEGG